MAATLEARSPGTTPLPTNGAWSRPAEDLAHQPVTDVLHRATEDSKVLIGEELQLARSELTSKAKTAGKGAGLLGAAGVVAIFAVLALTAGFILGLALVIPPWAAALVVAIVYGVIAGTLALAGRKQVQAAAPFIPERTVRSLSDLIRTLQAAWKRGEARS